MHRAVSVPLDPQLAEFIGKKGSSNGITFYNRKLGNDVIVALAPTSVAENLYAAAETMLVCDSTVLSTSALDRLFGEMLVGCSLVDRHVILTDDSNVDEFLKGINLASRETAPRAQLLDRIAASKSGRDASGTVRVDIDRAFPVKGIGTIALGIVTRGTVKVHDELWHSGGKKAIVRSMQSQDEDIREAGPSTRVGLALKGIESDEIEKGDIFAGAAAVPRVQNVNAKITSSKIAGEDIAKGRNYELVSNFSRSFCSVTEVTGDVVSLKLEKQSPMEKGSAFLLLRDKSPRIFAAGTVQ